MLRDNGRANFAHPRLRFASFVAATPRPGIAEPQSRQEVQRRRSVRSRGYRRSALLGFLALQAPASVTRDSNLPETVREYRRPLLAASHQVLRAGLYALFDCLIDQTLNRGIHLSKFKRFHETKWTKLRE